MYYTYILKNKEVFHFSLSSLSMYVWFVIHLQPQLRTLQTKAKTMPWLLPRVPFSWSLRRPVCFKIFNRWNLNILGCLLVHCFIHLRISVAKMWTTCHQIVGYGKYQSYLKMANIFTKLNNLSLVIGSAFPAYQIARTKRQQI